MFSVDALSTKSRDGHNFKLIEEFSFTCKDGTVIIVPVGAESDGASTPRIVWDIIPPFGLYWMAAFLHDYLYRYTKYTKEFCDGVLLEAMECLGVDEETREIIYDAVKDFGHEAFNNDRKIQPQ